MTQWARLPQKVVDHLATGGDLPRAGKIQAFLAARGVVADVSVQSDGTIVVESDVTIQKLRPALDSIEPADLDPAVIKRRNLVAAVRTEVATIRAIPQAERTPADRRWLLLVALMDLDDTPFEAAGR